MRRVLCLVFFVLCTGMLLWLNSLWTVPDGQALYRINAIQDEGTLRTIEDAASSQSAQFTAFSMREGDVKLATGKEQQTLLYECLAWNSDGLGIAEITGSILTNAQILNEEHVAMLSEEAAYRLFGRTHAAGETVLIGEETYVIVGTYRHYAPLGIMTGIAQASAIIPAAMDDSARRVFIWMKSPMNADFLYEGALGKLSSLSVSNDMGGLQSYDLTKHSALGRQLIRFILLVFAIIISIRLWKVLSAHRQLFAAHIQRLNRTCYALRTVIKLIPAFFRWMFPSVLVLVLVFYGISYTASLLVIDTNWVPTYFLDGEEWLSSIRSAFQVMNQSESLPMFAYVLSVQIERLSICFGIVGLACLWKISKTGSEGTSPDIRRT